MDIYFLAANRSARMQVKILASIKGKKDHCDPES
jgi:hypothetical protein